MNIPLSQLIIKHGGVAQVDFSELLYILPVGEYIISGIAFEILMAHPDVRHNDEAFKKRSYKRINLHNSTIIRNEENL